MAKQYYDNKKFIRPEIIERLNQILFDTINFKLNDNKKIYPAEFHQDFNSLGYRCQEFTKTHDGKHVLFMGCSETQGSNHSLDEAWANILYKKISNDEKLSGYFNIASIGHGILYQFLILLNYIENYAKPDEIYFLIPETTRAFIIEYHEDPIKISHQNMPSSIENFTQEIISNTHFNSLAYLRILESFCNNSGINLIWSTWHPDSEKFYKVLNFKNYLLLNMQIIDDELKINFDKYSDDTKSVEYNLKKQDGHKGLWFHRYWADIFYKGRKK
jgi:hypothetical protein